MGERSAACASPSTDQEPFHLRFPQIPTVARTASRYPTASIPHRSDGHGCTGRVRRVFHFAQQRVHLFGLQAAAGTSRAWRGHGRGDVHPGGFSGNASSTPPYARRDRVAKASRIGLSSEAASARTATAPRPKKFDREPEGLQRSSARARRLPRPSPRRVRRSPDQQDLPLNTVPRQRGLQLLSWSDPLMRGMLVRDNQPVAGCDVLGLVDAVRAAHSNRSSRSADGASWRKHHRLRQRGDRTLWPRLGEGNRSGAERRHRTDRMGRRSCNQAVRGAAKPDKCRHGRRRKVLRVRLPSRSESFINAWTISARIRPACGTAPRSWRMRVGIDLFGSSVGNSATTGWRSRQIVGISGAHRAENELVTHRATVDERIGRVRWLGSATARRSRPRTPRARRTASMALLRKSLQDIARAGQPAATAGSSAATRVTGAVPRRPTKATSEAVPSQGGGRRGSLPPPVRSVLREFQPPASCQKRSASTRYLAQRRRHDLRFLAAFDWRPGMRLAWRVMICRASPAPRAVEATSPAEPERADAQQILVIELWRLAWRSTASSRVGVARTAAVVGDADPPPPCAIGENVRFGWRKRRSRSPPVP